MSPRSSLSISKMCAAPWSYAGAQGGLEAFPSVHALANMHREEDGLPGGEHHGTQAGVLWDL